jgi:hypothetical protein
VWNVYDLPAYWWRYWVHVCEQHLDAMKEAERG